MSYVLVMPRNLCKTVRNSMVKTILKFRYNSHPAGKIVLYESQKHGARTDSHLLIVCSENLRVMRGKFNGFFIIKQMKKP